jgi:hypothetical protein
MRTAVLIALLALGTIGTVAAVSISRLDHPGEVKYLGVGIPVAIALLALVTMVFFATRGH